MLINHPLDCPICDQGGECDLQDEAMVYGSDRGRYTEFKRSVENKECGPIVKTIRTRCIHCTRCVRFSTEVAGNEVRGMFGRGEESSIGTYVNSFRNTELSGNLVDLCPVGALTSKPYAYKARNWELDSVDTVDFFDSMLSNIVVYKAPSEGIIRILPRNDTDYPENWISDRTRYAFDGLKYMQEGTSYAQSPSYLPFEFDMILGGQINLEIAYSAFNYVKAKGHNSVSISFISPKVYVDVPFFYGMTDVFTTFGQSSLDTILHIGLNLRYEASLLNTIRRREQTRRGISHMTVGSFFPLRYSHAHQGNSFNSLYAIYENRASFVKDSYITGKSVGVLVGVQAIAHNYSGFFQQMVLKIGKLFFTKTNKKDRLGFIHNSVGSLAFAHLGYSIKQNHGIASNGQNVTKLSFAQPLYQKNYNFANKGAATIIPVKTKSLYECTGSLISATGQLRKHAKVINELGTKQNKANFESELVALWWTQKKTNKGSNVNNFWDALSFFNEETPMSSNFQINHTSFVFNPFAINHAEQTKAPLALFAQPVRDFYINDSRAIKSITIADCSLFMNTKTNFIKEN